MQDLSTVGSRLLQARKKAGMTQKELADASGTSQTGIQSAEKRGATSIRKPTQIAKALNVNPVWLIEGTGPMHPEPGALNTRKFPLISWVTAGNWGEVVDNFAPGDAEEWITTSSNVSKHSFALKIDGDSMEPIIPHGSIIIVDPEIDATNRAIVIVRQNHDTEATCKRLIIDGGNRYLKPENSQYSVMELRKDAVMVGVVKQVILNL